LGPLASDIEEDEGDDDDDEQVYEDNGESNRDE
jgi:hypothetical protein